MERRRRLASLVRVIYRCSNDTLGGRWCPVCGKCSCTVRNQHGSRVWGPPKPTCPLHGTDATHPHGKVIDYDYVRGHDGIPVMRTVAVRSRGWDLDV